MLEAGKHVLCEKPLALTKEDITEMVRAARKSNCIFMVGQICRFTPAFAKTKELIDNGTLGELYFVESEYAHDYMNIVSNKQNWRADNARHGVIGGGCHAVDLLRWLAGDPEEIFAYGTHKLLPTVSYDDSTIAIMKFPNNVAGKVYVSTGCKRDYTMRTVIYGTKGTIICDNTSPTMQLFVADENGVAPEEPQIIELEVTSVNAWCYRAEINAAYKGVGSPVIEYRESSAQEWIPLSTRIEGTNIYASVDQLSEGTDYVARVVNGDDVSEEFTFTTETPEQLPNMSFDEWMQGDPGGYTWYPNAEGAELTWGTANSGVNMMNAVNSTRPENTFVAKKGGSAVRMESVYVFGKFAAGNIYTGQFGKAVITPVPGAELDWGVPFTTRPYSLKGYYAYAPKQIDYASDKYADKLGTMDKAQILVFLTDWENPFLVSTSTETFVDIKNDPSIIAVGELVTDQDTEGKYVEFECVLEYRDDRKPKYIVAVACSSLYGDYFTGGRGSVMHVDEWEFIYR
jgi:hypothetical protein